MLGAGPVLFSHVWRVRGFSIYLPRCCASQFQLNPVDMVFGPRDSSAGRIVAACGGWLADKIGGAGVVGRVRGHRAVRPAAGVACDRAFGGRVGAALVGLSAMAPSSTRAAVPARHGGDGPGQRDGRPGWISAVVAWFLPRSHEPVWPGFVMILSAASAAAVWVVNQNIHPRQEAHNTVQRG